MDYDCAAIVLEKQIFTMCSQFQPPTDSGSNSGAPEALACCCVSNEGGFKIVQKRVLSVGIGF